MKSDNNGEVMTTAIDINELFEDLYKENKDKKQRNVIKEMVKGLKNYIENAETLKTDFKPIKVTKNQFEPFNPRDNMNEATIVKLSFPIKQEYLDSENIMVLTVDKIDKFEKRIFLMPRPTNNLK